MLEEQQLKTKLGCPLTNSIVNYIMEEEPKIGRIIISAIEFTIKESNNHYNDILKALEPLLKEKTKSFLYKIFNYKKRHCRLGNSCSLQRCVFIHEKDNDIVDTSETESLVKKKHKEQNYEHNNEQNYEHNNEHNNEHFNEHNNEVVFNKVNESKYNLEDIREYACKYGEVFFLRRLNRGKFLIIFKNSESAQKLIDCGNLVLDDINIKKFFNVNIKIEDNNKENYIFDLLQKQKCVLNELSINYEKGLIDSLKEISNKIRIYILNKNGNDYKSNRFLKKTKVMDNVDKVIESSLYYNMFSN